MPLEEGLMRGGEEGHHLQLLFSAWIPLQVFLFEPEEINQTKTVSSAALVHKDESCFWRRQASCPTDMDTGMAREGLKA